MWPVMAERSIGTVRADAVWRPALPGAQAIAGEVVT
jgi:hypothetical protein